MTRFSAAVLGAVLMAGAAIAQVVGPSPPTPARPGFWHPIIYFEPGRSEVSPRGRQVVREVAMATKAERLQPISITAHTDTLGSVTLNQRLSDRRADAVARALVAEGVEPGIINAEGFGERRPAVATGDEVAEQLNRRATIDWASRPPNRASRNWSGAGERL